MSLLFDAIILIVAVLAIVLGAKRGFVKSVMGICTLIAALFVAFAFTPNVAEYIENTPMIESIGNGIADTVASLTKTGENSYDLSRLFRDMPEAFTQILERYGVDSRQLADAVNPQSDAGADRVENLAQIISEPVAKAIAGVVSFLLLFVAAVIVLKLLTWILDLIFRLPVLKKANTVLGLIVGVLSAFVWAWVLSALSVIFIRAMSSISPEVFSTAVIENTVILKFFANDGFANLLRMVIG